MTADALNLMQPRLPRRHSTIAPSHYATLLFCLAALSAPALAATPVWQPLGQGLNETAIRVVAVDPGNAKHLLAGSSRAVYVSHDGGARWRESLRPPAQADVIGLAIDPFDGRRLLAATSSGLYGSADGGQHWQRLFRGSGTGEARCQAILFHPAHRQQAFLGTAGGLFVSADGGTSWRKLGARLSNRSVVGLAIHASRPERIYAVTDRGLFVGGPDDASWQQIIAAGGAEESSDDPTNQPEEPAEESEASVRFTALAIDPQEPQKLYLGSSRGVFVSQDSGASWARLEEPGLGSVELRHLIACAHSPSVIYAATPQGVSRYQPQHDSPDAPWQPLYAGLPTHGAQFLAATSTAVFAATDAGLYKLDLSEEQLAQGTWPHARELLADFPNEPTIVQVQQAAIRRAAVDPEIIKRWRGQARAKALLPVLSLDYDRRHDTFLDALGSTTNPSFDRVVSRDDPSNRVNLGVRWDIGNLIWSTDQTAIDVRSRLMVQLRDDILNEITRHYFERRRLQLELVTNPPAEPKDQLDKELRLEELTAMIDGLTGGWFSEQLRSKP